VHAVTRRLADVVIALAVALAIVAVAILPFLNPPYVAFAQGRAEATAWTGFTEAELRTVTDAILADLTVGPPDFDVAIDGVPVLNEREQSHMRDVRTVFMGFFALAIVAGMAAIVIAARRRDAAARTHTWRAAHMGSLVLAVGLVALGGVALVAFDVLFEIFHQLLFAGGSYTFDPETERLVQLFPFRFWQETAIAVGVVAVILGLVVAHLASRRGAAAAAEAAQAQATATHAPVVADPA
jgi:integral membrane protein (TIGR01906 family)